MRELFKSIGVSLDNRGPAGSWRDLFGYFRKNVIQIFDEIQKTQHKANSTKQKRENVRIADSIV